MNLFRSIMAALLLLGFLAGSSPAATITMAFQDQANTGVLLTINSTAPSTAGAELTYAGIFRWAISGTSGISVSNPFYTYCIDLFQNVSYSPATYNVVDLSDAPITTGAGQMGHDKALRLAELVADVTAAEGSPFNFANRVGGDPADDIFAAAFQLAVWEVVFENGPTLNLNDGNFVSNNAQVNTQANTWLALINGSYTDPLLASMLNVKAVTSSNMQDQVFLSPGTGQILTPVPEPASLAAWALFCLIGCGWRTRRRQSA